MKLFLIRGYKVISINKYNLYFYNYVKTKILDFGIINDFNYIDDFLKSNNLNIFRSQLSQDLFVLSVLDFKKDGYFVEFGAYDGLSGSNSYALEMIGWSGVLAEPSLEFKNIQKIENVNPLIMRSTLMVT